jgi:hypothetical protein
LLNKNKEEYGSGLIGVHESLDNINLIRRLVFEGRVEEFMKFAGYESDIVQ